MSRHVKRANFHPRGSAEFLLRAMKRSSVFQVVGMTMLLIDATFSNDMLYFTVAAP